MKQNEMILNLLQTYRECGELEPYFSSNPGYTNDPLKEIVTILKSYGTDLESLNLTSTATGFLEDSLIDFYSKSLFTGFQTGIDMAMVLLGYKPIYNVLPDKKKKDKDVEAFLYSFKELSEAEGYYKVMKFINSLGYNSVSELIDNIVKEG